MSDYETELRRVVERIVRPLAAADFRKQRMREELLAHVHSIFQQQLELSVDEHAAIAEAAKRLGDPNKLSDSLQETVPSYDRLLMFFQGKTPHTVLVAGLRFALVVNLLYFAVLIPVVCFSLANGWASSVDILSLINSPLILPFLVLMPVWAFSVAIVMWILDRLAVQPASEWPPKNAGQLVAELWNNSPSRIAVCVGTISFVAALLRVQPGSIDFLCIAMQLLTLVALGVPVAWSLTQEVYAKRRRAEAWTSLVID